MGKMHWLEEEARWLEETSLPPFHPQMRREATSNKCCSTVSTVSAFGCADGPPFWEDPVPSSPGIGNSLLREECTAVKGPRGPSVSN